MVDLNDLSLLTKEGKPTRVIAEESSFKVRVINLGPKQNIPTCSMQWNTIFFVIEGELAISVDGKESSLSEGNLLIAEPADISMKSSSGARLLGIQVRK